MLNAQTNRLHSVRHSIARIPGDVSNDAVGAYVAKLEEMFAPSTHAAALDPATPIVVGSRGTGKSFWAGALGKDDTRNAASKAYPKLHLADLKVAFGFTGIGGEEGVGVDALNSQVPPDATVTHAKNFWWTAIFRAIERARGRSVAKFSELLPLASDWEQREDFLQRHERELRSVGSSVLVIFDALDMVATTWPRRRLLTEALLEVIWAMRAYRSIKLKAFLRPDQIDDDALRFVELPKLRTGAVRLQWTGIDLYGLLFARLALDGDTKGMKSFELVLRELGMESATRDQILARQWSLVQSADQQAALMSVLAGPFMAAGIYGYKKGKTYDWPLTHLADAFNEVTPRSFLELMRSAASYGSVPENLAVTPDGLRHGLRAASRTRVDQLHQEFPWIKGVLAPLAGLLLPLNDKEVYKAWKQASTVKELTRDATVNNYLPPFAAEGAGSERDLYEALQRIGVMFRRRDERVDMPDLFRVAAKLLKKGATAPLA